MDEQALDQTAPEQPEPEDTSPRHEACITEAWRLLSEGVYAFRAIARGVNEKTGCNHDHNWVKRALVKHGKMVAETLESGAVDSRAKYLAALYARRATAAGIAANGQKKDTDRIAALRLMVDCDEKIAAAEGVVTQRTRQEQTGAGGGPVQTQVGLTPESLALMRQREAEDNGSTGD